MERLYIAVAICVGSPPAIPVGTTETSAVIGPCDYDYLREGLSVPKKECLRRLELVHMKGNYVKFCIPENADFDGFTVVWSAP